MKEPLGLVAFGYALSPDSNGRWWCQEPLCDNRTVSSNFSRSGEEGNGENWVGVVGEKTSTLWHH